jgi:hypothetical protein
MLVPLTPAVQPGWWNTHILTNTLEKKATLHKKNPPQNKFIKKHEKYP